MNPTRTAVTSQGSAGTRRTMMAQDLDGTGHLRSAVLIDLAEQAAAAILPRVGTATDIKTLFMDPVGAIELTAHAKLRHRSDDAMVVEVGISRSDGVLVCLVSLTYRVVNVQSVAQPDRDAEPSHPRPEPRGTLRERRADALIAAATEVIAKKGFASATMRDIAKAAGTHVPTLYDYFPSKEVLLEAIYQREMEATLRALLHDVDRTAPAREQLRQLLTNQMAHSVENRQAGALLNREFRHLSQPVRVEMTALYRSLIAPFEDILTKGIEQGELRDVDTFLMANIFETAGDMLSLRPFFFKDRPVDEHLESLCCILIDGLAASP